MNSVKEAVEGLAHGDLDVDIDSSDMEGAYEELASQVNQSIFNVNMALSEIQELGQNLKNGNFNEISEIGEEMPGIYGDIVGDINTAIEQISEDIKNLKGSAEELDEAADLIADSSQELNTTAENVSDSV